ncbi:MULTISPECIES: hypothetical protein [Acidithiobacillus]|uniref:Uncharacterized protein n=1 Tax=Acidithiobacillus ferriphilus TaxID=1689834 RepID=A0ABU6FKC7_9PROT|nr:MULTISPECIES: hypothetical protein [Acidithiobacillus]MBU2845269.1 hypothetical protein [Acidithiobacillus ferriphilus]MEB8487073.1 hypothetical protein [Acidithiobacillus ferriphilus]MEB8489328.1 hypothetical protein [Acidithiobacillus ferriphilus]MEB8491951.1 hypothetical protein [Acidithiobacillus ferriphilus]MEB8512507.1 hypothetical protein [Acidithiobacillus ferriphilus]
MAEVKVFSTGIDPNGLILNRFTQSCNEVTPSILWQHLPILERFRYGI